MELLASIKGRKYVTELIEKDLSYKITFKKYPKNKKYILDLREKINSELLKDIKKKM